MAKRTREVRTVFSEDAYRRLERQAKMLDITPSTWIRWLAMEKVTTLELATSSSRMTVAVEEMIAFMSNVKEEIEKVESVKE